MLAAQQRHTCNRPMWSVHTCTYVPAHDATVAGIPTERAGTSSCGLWRSMNQGVHTHTQNHTTWRHVQTPPCTHPSSPEGNWRTQPQLCTWKVSFCPRVPRPHCPQEGHRGGCALKPARQPLPHPPDICHQTRGPRICTFCRPHWGPLK